MPICIICEADGVLEAAGNWYCKDHLDDGFIATAVMIARIKGLDEDRGCRSGSDLVAQAVSRPDPDIGVVYILIFLTILVVLMIWVYNTSP